MTVLEFRKLLDIWTRNSWLCSHDFKCDDQIIEESIRVFQSNYSRWYPNDRTINVYNIQYTPQLIAMLLYRISRNVYLSDLNSNIYGGFAGVVKDAYLLLARHIGQIKLFYSADIGEGLRINHGVGTVVGARCKMGKNCIIHQNCTIGDRNGGRTIIGDNVVIYAGAMLLGDITIGDNSIIGANSVVTKNVLLIVLWLEHLQET